MATITLGMAGRRIWSCPRFSPISLIATPFLQGRQFSSVNSSKRSGCQKLLPKTDTFLFPSRSLILGIETSCDDTGACVMNLEGKVLGEALSTQLSARYFALLANFLKAAPHSLILGMAVWFPPLPWPGTQRKSRGWWRWLWKGLDWIFNIWQLWQWPTGQDWKDL